MVPEASVVYNNGEVHDLLLTIATKLAKWLICSAALGFAMETVLRLTELHTSVCFTMSNDQEISGKVMPSSGKIRPMYCTHNKLQMNI